MDRMTVTGCKFLTPAVASKNELLDEIRRHQKYYDRLADYEDTGLTPEEIASLKDTAIRGDGYHKKYSAALADLDAKDAEIATLKKAFALACRILEDLQIALSVMREARDSNGQ